MSRIACLMVLLFAATARAQSPDAERELFRERVEQLSTAPEMPVAGVRLAAARFLARLYEQHGFAPEWNAESSEQLTRAIAAVQDDGLDPEDYLRSALEHTPAGRDRDVLQSEALVRLLYHLLLGKVDPSSFDSNWNFSRELPETDPVAFVQEIIDSGDVFARIEREKPQLELYRQLKAAYARQREIAAAGGWSTLPAGETLKPGVRDARVPALRARLAAEGLDAALGEGGDSFDPAL
jgi:L,D-transpeptidase YcbB